MKSKELIDGNYAKIDKSAHVSEMIGLLEKTRQKAALVFDGKRYIGLSHKNLLMKARLDLSKLKVGKIIAHVPILNGEEELRETARLMYTSDSPLLPVIKNSVLLGIVKAIDVANQIKNMPEQRKKKAKEVMTAGLILAKENDRVGKAIEMMKQMHINRIPIVDEKGNLVSISSFTDILRHYLMRQQSKSEHTYRSPSMHRAEGKGFDAERTDITGFPIKNLASLVTITANEDDYISEVIELMDKHEITSIVIVRDRKPVGIITVRDLVKLIIPSGVHY